MVKEFIERGNTDFNKDIKGITPAAMEKLMMYQWPGNVREIRNAIEYAFVLCQDELIDSDHLPKKIIKGGIERTVSINTGLEKDSVRENTLTSLRATKGNQSEAAKRLGVSRVTIWKQIYAFSLNSSEYYILYVSESSLCG
jgi:two-component system response regulator HydG